MRMTQCSGVRVIALVSGILTACTLDFARFDGDEQRPPPVIKGVQPSSAFANELVTITGTSLSFKDAMTTSVTFPGGAMGNVTSAASGQLVVKVPDNAGSGAITVSTPGGSTTSPMFTFSGPGEPRNNSFAGTVVFQASPVHAIVTSSDAIIVNASNPLDAGTFLVLRALPGAVNPVFAQAATVPFMTDARIYSRIFPMPGGNVIALGTTGGALEFAPPTGAAVSNPADQWTQTARSTAFTSSTDPAWTTLVGTALDQNRLLVAFLSDAMGGGQTAQVRIIDLTSPTAAVLRDVLTAEPMTTGDVVPSLTLSSDGSLAVLVAGDGHGVAFAPGGSGRGTDLPGAVMAAAPAPDLSGDVIVARSDGHLDRVVPSTGMTTMIVGPGPVPLQMFATEGAISLLSFGVPAITVLDVNDGVSTITLPYAPTSMTVNPDAPTGSQMNPDGTAVVWNANSTLVSKVSLTHREVDWTTDVPYVGEGVAAFGDGIMMNYESPTPTLVALAATNLTTPTVTAKSPIIGGRVISTRRNQMWAFSPTLAVQESVNFNTTQVNQLMQFTPPGTDQIAAIAPGPDDTFALLAGSDGESTVLTDVENTQTLQLNTTAAALLAVADQSSTMLYMVIGSQLLAVDTSTFTQTASVSIGGTGSTATGQTLDVSPDGSTAIVTTGSEVFFFALPGLTPSPSVELSTDGGALSPSGRYFYCVSPGVHGTSTTLARINVQTHGVDILFEMPTPGPERRYSTDTAPLTTYAFTFTPQGGDLYIDNQLSGDVLHVD
jgi:hypothetical protein